MKLFVSTPQGIIEDDFTNCEDVGGSLVCVGRHTYLTIGATESVLVVHQVSEDLVLHQNVLVGGSGVVDIHKTKEEAEKAAFTARNIIALIDICKKKRDTDET